MPEIFTENYSALPPFDEREILRYAGVRGEADEAIRALLAECLKECEGAFACRVCYAELTKEELFALVQGARESKALQRHLEGGERALLFAATVGLGIDRLIARYASVSPAKALIFQAIGSERIEELCDGFCKSKNAGGRFSPGYGDFPLQAQRDIFRVLDCVKKIGVSLTDSLLMTPTKSVTALAKCL